MQALIKNSTQKKLSLLKTLVLAQCSNLLVRYECDFLVFIVQLDFSSTQQSLFTVKYKFHIKRSERYPRKERYQQYWDTYLTTSRFCRQSYWIRCKLYSNKSIFDEFKTLNSYHIKSSRLEHLSVSVLFLIKRLELLTLFSERCVGKILDNVNFFPYSTTFCTTLQTIFKEQVISRNSIPYFRIILIASLKTVSRKTASTTDTTVKVARKELSDLESSHR